jgi:CubicO group peptidase (beta-lactamase class C family)
MQDCLLHFFGAVKFRLPSFIFLVHLRNMPKSYFRLRASLISVSAAMALYGCGSAPAESPSQAATPAVEKYAKNAALSEKKLRSLITPFFEDEALGETRALVIMHGGIVIGERYAPGYNQDSRLVSWSMAKSVTATLIGFMVADGLLVLDDPAPVPEWTSAGDERGKITLRHLLNMSSGLDHTEIVEDDKAIYETDTTRMLFLDGRENVARYAEKRPMEAPAGTKFEYSTATTHILCDIMTRTLTPSSDPEVRREAMMEYARGRLFEPLGMKSATPEFDRSGTMLGGSLIHATARDWAKFGEFLRNNGSVRAAQLLPTSWPRFMKSSSPDDAAYGGQIWLNRNRPEGRDQVLFPGRAPSDVFAALGHLGQFVVVSPQHKLVIVRLGKTQDDKLEPIDDQLAKVIAAFPKS